MAMTRKIRRGFLPWLHELFASPYGHWYVRLWGGVMQLRHYGNLTTGITTPGHGEHHRWWVRLEAPLSGGRCWWCGLGCYPGPLLGYNTRPIWLTSRVRRWLWRAGFRPVSRRTGQEGRGDE